jgi:carbohydrate diacid regulator
LSYRLKQFGDLTGLAPARRFADAIVCWIALGAEGGAGAGGAAGG